MFNFIEPNYCIASKWGMQMKMFNRMHFVIKGMNGKVQPTFSDDVCLAIFNALKDEKT